MKKTQQKQNSGMRHRGGAQRLMCLLVSLYEAGELLVLCGDST